MSTEPAGPPVAGGAQERPPPKAGMICGVATIVLGFIIGGGVLLSGGKDEKVMQRTELEQLLLMMVARGDTRFEGLSNHELKRLYSGKITWEEFRRRHRNDRYGAMAKEAAVVHYRHEAQHWQDNAMERAMHQPAAPHTPPATPPATSPTTPSATPSLRGADKPPASPPPRSQTAIGGTGAVAPGAATGKWTVGEAVKMRDSANEEWTDGTVVEVLEDGTPMIALAGRKRGMKWAEVKKP